MNSKIGSGSYPPNMALVLLSVTLSGLVIICLMRYLANFAIYHRNSLDLKVNAVALGRIICRPGPYGPKTTKADVSELWNRFCFNKILVRF